eukprot:2352121-Pyramimonas_sp.AAC.1
MDQLKYAIMSACALCGSAGARQRLDAIVFGDGAAKPAPTACSLHATSTPVLPRRARDRSAALPLRTIAAAL